jgi:hypothetical protein
MIKRVLLASVMAVSMLGAKTFTFKLSEASQAGSTQLAAGQYRLKVDGTAVALLDGDGNPVTASPKVEESSSKFDHTAVHASKVDGKARIEEITLGGTKTKVVFR